jgi:glycine dehydrogenase subunit 2
MDRFLAAMLEIAERAERDPASFATQPETTPVSRVDEVKAARDMRFTA